MLVNVPPGRTRSPAGFSGRLYAYAFFEEFILLYPLYAVLFADTGLSTAEISTLFIIWSVTSFALEIPSGVVADMVSRRLLLVVGPILMGIGFALWVAAPSYWSFAAGFVLWGAHGSLQSGALEALVYEELDALGRASSYARVIGRVQAVGTVAAAGAMALATPVFAAGGFAGIGTASVAACLLASGLAMTLPETRRRHEHDPPRFVSTLRAGIDDVRTNRRLLTAVVFLIATTAVWGALDEYVPLLAVEGGASRADVPLLVLVVYAGVALGGLLAGAGNRLSRRGLAWLLAMAAVALATGATLHQAAGFAFIGAAFCVFQMTQIVADARIQALTNGEARSTVTSLAGFGVEVMTVGVFATYALGSQFTGHAVLFAVSSIAYLAIAIGALRSGRRLRLRSVAARSRRWRAGAT